MCSTTRLERESSAIKISIKPLSEKSFKYIQLCRERLSGKVHTTIPKGIVDGFEFTVACTQTLLYFSFEKASASEASAKREKEK